MVDGQTFGKAVTKELCRINKPAINITIRWALHAIMGQIVSQLLAIVILSKLEETNLSVPLGSVWTWWVLISSLWTALLEVIVHKCVKQIAYLG